MLLDPEEVHITSSGWSRKNMLELEKYKVSLKYD